MTYLSGKLLERTAHDRDDREYLRVPIALEDLCRDRRDGKLDDKYRYSVQSGYFIDLRRGQRRKSLSEDPIISLN